MTYYALLTQIGLAKIANAHVTASTVHWTTMVVGDGGGSATTPQQSDTSLVNEVFAAPINSLEIDSENDTWLVAELVIPPHTGGWTIREVAVIDADGDMVVTANFPPTYKPVLAEGSGRETVIRLIVETTNADIVTLKIDPTIVLATRQYVDGRTPDATTEVRGLVELATPAEAAAGTDALRAITPAGLAGAADLPHEALPLPTIATSDHRVAVTPAAASAGGTVSISGGERIALAEARGAGMGRMRAWTLPPYQSPDLDADTMYYLRMQISGGVPVIYLTQGADDDPVPGGLRGLPGADAGGGFDSTALDMLLARVITGAAGTTPVVTALANAWRLWAAATGEVVVSNTVLSWVRLCSGSLHWGRRPAMLSVGLAGASVNGDEMTTPGGGQAVQKVAVRPGAWSRYGWAVEFVYQDTASDYGAVRYTMEAHA